MNAGQEGTISAINRRAFCKGTMMGGTAFALRLHAQSVEGQDTSGRGVPWSPFALRFSEGVLSSLRFGQDTYRTDYLEPQHVLGHVVLTLRRPGGDWRTISTAEVDGSHSTVQDLPGGGRAAEYRLVDAQGPLLQVTVRLAPKDAVLVWTVDLRNDCNQPLEVGDLSLPLPMHSTFEKGEPSTASVLKHSFVSGSGSFLFWMRSNSVGPFLMMTPQQGTHLEYWDHLPPSQPHDDKPPVYRVYVHSAAKGAEVGEAGGRWRQPHTSRLLQPAGNAGADQRYGFEFAWAPDYAGVRDLLVAAGLLDIHVVPGMTVPSDLFARVSLRTTAAVQRVEAEFPGTTTVERVSSHAQQEVYQVRFARLGENMLTVHHGDGGTTRLEFFVTEPLETLIGKRAAFIAAHQHRDPAKWYNGLLAEWNMDSGVMLGPDNYDRIKGWRIYEVTCDDPGLSKPAFLAAKNAEYPVQGEITALDDYITHFVWGGLQRTTEETDSYGIYGIPDWKKNRDSADPGSKGKRHLWRCYDYPHIVLMYFSMYRIAHRYAGVSTRLSAEQYLQCAYGTAIAMFTLPQEIVGWSAYETGFYNELVIPQLVNELLAVGQTSNAEKLRRHWEKKVQFFIAGKPDLFGSEYAFDSTGFESTQAIAHYALTHPECPGITPSETQDFLDRQIKANIFCRGSVEPAYYYLGSDYRGSAGDAFTLSYMSQMGGWAVMDYALHFAAEPAADLRLGYASYLSTWALINSGTAATNYGYWFQGAANDGGAGGGFEPAARSVTWLGQPNDRGSWYYSCESDLGFCGALRAASTLVSDDPIFGRFCFGGDLQQQDEWLEVVPRDGLRQRFHGRLTDGQLDLEITGARLRREVALRWNPKRAELHFCLEGAEARPRQITLRVAGLPRGNYHLEHVGAKQTFTSDGKAANLLTLQGTPQHFAEMMTVKRVG